MNFKKCTSLILVFLLLVSNIGLAFNVHYCGDEIASVTFTQHNPEKNCCGIAEKKSNCCSDKVVHIQKKSDNVLVKCFAFQMQDFIPSADWKPMVSLAVVPFKSNTITSYFCDAHAPPLFKLYSQYIFYDRF